MNKTSTRQKRTIGRDSPLSKRPKLNFRTRESVDDNKNKGKHEAGDYYGSIREKNDGEDSFGDKINENLAAGSDWDDDFSGDMLEKVCLIADLSQAMVNKQHVPAEIDREKVEPFKGNDVPPIPVSAPSTNLIINEELERLRLDFEKLQEKLKTKEGEVQILRSQLKQNEDAKQAAALQNMKHVEDIQKKFSEKISTTEKALETAKTKLLFKDMEYRTMSERCRQLEYNLSKSKLEENYASQIDVGKSFGPISHSLHPKTQLKETENESVSTVPLEKCRESTVYSKLSNSSYHEGKYLAKMICPEFFKFVEEPSIVSFYTYSSGNNCRKSKLDFDKREKYKWSDLPKQTVFIKHLYDSVTSFFAHETFAQNELKEEIKKVIVSCEEILIYYKKVFQFLENLQIHNSECDDPDQSLLENDEAVEILKIKNLLDSKKLNEEECGIEGRRSLALIYSLMKTSEVAFDLLKNKTDFILLLKDLAAGIGNLRRPLRYTGILTGITFILQKILAEKNLKKEIVTLINEVVEEIIFARPKLNVLREVVNVFAAGKHHMEFLVALCRKASVESCALYMDSKLKQAMFFTKKACPLKLLCMQIMGLACLPSSKAIKWDLANCIIKWLNNSINTPYSKKIKWLPTNPLSAQQDRCFDVAECLSYILTLCLKDFDIDFSPCDSKNSETMYKEERTKEMDDMISAIGYGAILLKRILKADQRQLHDNTYSLRFAVLLKALMPAKSDLWLTNHMTRMSSIQKEAITWIIDLLESDLRNQDCCVKQNTSALSDIDIFDALKIDDESKIY